MSGGCGAAGCIVPKNYGVVVPSGGKGRIDLNILAPKRPGIFVNKINITIAGLSAPKILYLKGVIKDNTPSSQVTKGTITYDGGTFTGEHMNGLPNGYGEFKRKDIMNSEKNITGETTKIGNWKDGLLNGEGEECFPCWTNLILVNKLEKC